MKLLRYSLFALLAFAVLAFGTVEEWSQAILEVGAALLLVYWAILQFRRDAEFVFISPIIPPLGALVFVVVAQLVFHTTASVYSTRVELQLLVTYVIVVQLIAQAFIRTHHWRNFLWFVMILGFVVSLIGILQSLTWNGKLYWVRNLHFFGYPFGPYANRNHFAGFAELVIPVALVPLVLGKVRRERLLLVAILALVPMAALVLSASRGGIVSFVVEVVLLFALLLIRRSRARHVLIGGAVLIAAMLLVSWIGVQQVFQRFMGAHVAEATMGKRASMRQDTWRIFLDHPVIGTGLGTLQQVFPPYESLYDGKVVNHAHNDYLEGLAETGILGGMACGWFLGILLLGSLKGIASPETPFGAVLNLSGLLGCCGLLVHSLVDFNLHIPANAMLFLVSAHMATTRLQTVSPNPGMTSRPSLKKRNQEAVPAGTTV